MFEVPVDAVSAPFAAGRARTPCAYARRRPSQRARPGAVPEQPARRRRIRASSPACGRPAQARTAPRPRRRAPTSTCSTGWTGSTSSRGSRSRSAARSTSRRSRARPSTCSTPAARPARRSASTRWCGSRPRTPCTSSPTSCSSSTRATCWSSPPGVKDGPDSRVERTTLPARPQLRPVRQRGAEGVPEGADRRAATPPACDLEDGRGREPVHHAERRPPTWRRSARRSTRRRRAAPQRIARQRSTASNVASIAFDRQTGTSTVLDSTVPLAALERRSRARSARSPTASTRRPTTRPPASSFPPPARDTGAPAAAGHEQLFFKLFLPAGPPPAGGWPVAIFGHGFGDSMNGAPWVVASSLALAGHRHDLDQRRRPWRRARSAR